MTEYLIKKGININEVQRDGSTALHGAAFYGQEIVIQLLIENGIDIQIKIDSVQQLMKRHKQVELKN